LFFGSFALPAWAESTLDVVKKRGELIAGVRYDMPPYGYVGGDGNVVGLDIEIVKAIAKKLGVKLQLKQITAQSRIPMLQNGAVDLLAAGLAHTIEREQAIDFTITYFQSGTLFLVKSDSKIASYRDLANKTIAVIQGTPYLSGLQKKEASVKPLTLQEYPQAVLAVVDGKADALMADDTTLAGLIGKQPGVKIVGDIRDFPRWYVALGIRKDDSAWRNYLNSVLIEMWEQGALQQTVSKMGLSYSPNFEIEPWKF
jgi:polar amino acid transport system substrate-binding protein